jgi:hypothetical protein
MIDLLGEPGVYAFARVSGDDRAIAIFNNSDHEYTAPVPLTDTGLRHGATLPDRYYGPAPAAAARGGALDVRIGPRSIAVLR